MRICGDPDSEEVSLAETELGRDVISGAKHSSSKIKTD